MRLSERYNFGWHPDRLDIRENLQVVIGQGDNAELLGYKEIEALFNGGINHSELMSAFRVYNNYTAGRWPHSGGYMDQLPDVYRITQLFDSIKK